MGKQGFIQVFLIMSVISPSIQASCFFEDHARGWHWYEPIEALALPKEVDKMPEVQVSKAQKPKEVVKLKPKIDLKDPSVVIEKYSKLIQKAQDRALVHPSPENLYTYMALQQDAMLRSHRFSQLWQRVVLYNPELDDTLKFPTVQGARPVFYAQEKQDIEEKIKALKDTHGLYFFFSKNCPYCHTFAPVVKAFASKHKWTVFAISLDGGTVPEFSKVVLDNGMAARLNVTRVPALFVANPRTGKILPIAHGIIAQEDIERRILLLTTGGAR